MPQIDEQAEIVRLLDDLLIKEQQAKEAAEGVLDQIDLIKKPSSPAPSAANWAPTTPARRAWKNCFSLKANKTLQIFVVS